jgi:hydrogenase maturation protease
MIAVIGCGNPTRSDDGAGPEAVRRLLARGNCPAERVRLLDAGTDGMAVMFAAKDAQALILIDAVRSGSAPGAVFELDGAALERPHVPTLTLHDFRWDHALYAARRIFGEAFPARVVVQLIEAETVAFGISLSPRVSAGVDFVVSRIEDVVRNSSSEACAASPAEQEHTR